ncbi:MAG: nucleotidyltransferase family protein [Epsilonproteobacteria bacterium]|nr:nucleotidyltransferase family protein [Campylobacterota bacterium]
MKKDDILLYLRENKEAFFQKYGVIKIGIFGSYAKGFERFDSDIDIVIKMQKDKKSLKTFFGLKRELEKQFGKKVDLGIEESLKPLVKDRIKKEIEYA